MKDYVKELDGSILEYVEQCSRRVDNVFRGVLSQVPVAGFIKEITEKNIVGKGKRLRSSMLFCVTDLYGGNVDEASYYAAVVESTHQASLIHDDIVDADVIRRGDLSVFGKYGTGLAVLAGDTVISLATKFIVYVPVSHMPESLSMAVHTWNKLTAGAVEELLIKDASMSSWESMAYAKTAVLFECAYKFGGLASSCSYEVIKSLGEAGYKYGLAFQMADDMADAFKVLKDGVLSRDLRRGYLTFPLAYLYEHGNEAVRKKLNAWIRMRVKRMVDGVPVPGAKEVFRMIVGDVDVGDVSVSESDILDIIKELDKEEVKIGCFDMIDAYVKSSLNIIGADRSRFKDSRYLEYLKALQEYGISRVLQE